MYKPATPEIEAKLIQSLKELKERIHTLTNKNQTIGAYWKKNDPASPFEQELTLAQLASVDPLNLLKKKSFTEDKALALSNAINKALSQPSLTLVEPKAKELKHNFIINKEDAPEDLIYINGLLQACDLFNSENNFRQFFLSLYKSLGAKQLKNTHDTKYNFPEKLWLQASDIFLSHLNEVNLHWQTALSSPAISLERLVSPYLVNSNLYSSNPDFFAFLFAPILKINKAQPLRIGKILIPYHYCLDPRSTTVIYKALVNKKNIKTLSSFINVLGVSFSLCDLKLMFSKLSSST